MSRDLLFPQAHPDAIFADEEEQTFSDFLDFGRRKPNTKGTGRWKLTKERDKLALFYFGNESKRPSNLNDIADFISATFCLEVKFFEQLDAIDIDTNTFTLDMAEYDITVINPKKRSSSKQKTVDVFSLFDVLVHKADKPFAAIVGIFDCLLSEEGEEVLGRACGDRVACVSLQSCIETKTIVATIVHELFHTIGFDHCTSERCVMNALMHEDWLFLSSTNMKKLKLYHEEESLVCNYLFHALIGSDGSKFEYNYYLRLLTVVERLGKDFRKDKMWLKKAIKLFSI